MEKMIEKLLEYLNNTDAFFKEQAPDFVNQLLAFEIWRTQFGLTFGLSFLVLCLVLVAIGAIGIKRNWECAPGLFIFAVPVFLLGMILSLSYYNDLKQLELAPKVYLLKEVRRLVR